MAFLFLQKSKDAAAVEAPWCHTAQHALAGLDAEDDARLTVQTARYFNDTQDFEDSRVQYALDGGGGGDDHDHDELDGAATNTTTATNATTLRLNISGHNAHYQDPGDARDFSSKCIVAAKELACKMASAARVADELELGNRGRLGGEENTSSRSISSMMANGSIVTCQDINAAAIAAAEQLLAANGSDSPGAHTLDRFQSRGRPLCLEADEPSFNGPLFVKEALSVVDNGTCLVVTSRVLGPTSLKIPGGIGGTQYCKLLSPARVIDYMMIDSLKNTSTCLNV